MRAEKVQEEPARIELAASRLDNPRSFGPMHGQGNGEGLLALSPTELRLLLESDFSSVDSAKPRFHPRRQGDLRREVSAAPRARRRAATYDRSSSVVRRRRDVTAG